MAKFKPPFPAFGTNPPKSGANPFAKGGKPNPFAKGKPKGKTQKKKSKGK